MKHFVASVLPLLLLLLVCSCKPEDEIYSKDSGVKLQFSTDTVSFDTVFVSQGSVTRRLKVYNPSKNAVKISEIKIGKLGLSPFSLIINGELKPMATDFTLRGEDSLLILVKAYIDPNNNQNAFIVEDDILFKLNGNEQKVHVEAYGQNANYFKDTFVCNTTWSPPKAYILYGDVIVPEGCTLTILPGTKIYAHPGAILYVAGKLNVQGSAQNRAVFQHDRRDSLYANIPGLWYGIYLAKKSKANTIQFADIRNATFGITVDSSANVSIKNTVVKNCFSTGVLGILSAFEMENCLIANCGQYAVAGAGGGNYKLNFCTIANYTSEFKRDTESLTFNDSAIYNKALIIRNTNLEIKNSIIWAGTRNGELKDELLFYTVAGLDNITISNSLLQTNCYLNEAKFRLPASNNLFNRDPEFKQPGDGSVPARKINYTLKDSSPLIGAGQNAGVSIDLPGSARPQGLPNPDIGAYENAK